jgi:Matrixin
MIPGLHLPPKDVSPSYHSWLGSLRPNATSLRPAVELEAPARAPESRSHRWHLALACGLACSAVAVAAVAWTTHSHARVRSVQSYVSGRAGLRKTSSGADERWGPAALTITIDPTLAHATPAAKDAIMTAFGAWAASGASLPQLSFDATSTPGGAAQDGVNRLLVGPITVPGQEKDLAITISYADTDTGEIVEADTIFNDAYDWTSIGSPDKGDGKGGCNNRYDLQNVATHEAGHFFGLGEDYDDQATTMYVSSLRCQTSKRALSKSDVSVVSGLYAQAAANSPQSAACGARIAGGKDTGGGALAAMGVVAFALARRHRRS